MRHNNDEVEFYNLFISKIQHMRFALDEIGKMIEARLENLGRYVYESEEIKYESFKNSKIEIQKSIDGFKYSIKALCENLKSELKISLDKIDPEKEQNEISEYKKGA